MREARFRGAARRTFDELSEADQRQVAALIRYLESDPEPDGRYKYLLNPDDEAQFLCVFDDGVWRIVYHASSEAALLIDGITRRSTR